jgi:hypothetical protein
VIGCGAGFMCAVIHRHDAQCARQTACAAVQDGESLSVRPQHAFIHFLHTSFGFPTTLLLQPFAAILVVACQIKHMWFLNARQLRLQLRHNAASAACSPHLKCGCIKLSTALLAMLVASNLHIEYNQECNGTRGSDMCKVALRLPPSC